MRRARWVVVVMALVGCGGKSVGEGGNAGSAGESFGGATSVGGDTSTGGTTQTIVCFAAQGPGTPVRFRFESTQALWLRQGCSLEYSVTQTCKDKVTPITTQAFCSQPCGSNDNGCSECGACPSGGLAVGPGSAQIAEWDGFVYTNGTSSSGCACYNRSPATVGTYQIAITAFLSSDDALTGSNGYNFSTTFSYPTTDFVHVPLEFMGL